MTTFYLIRHGLNDYLGVGKLAGRMPNVHLSAEGHHQAEALGRHLSSIKFKASTANIWGVVTFGFFVIFACLE